MTTALEDRLAAAADQLDREIDRRLSADTAVQPVGARTPVAALALVACVASLLIAGLVWLSADGAGTVAAPDPSVIAPVTASETSTMAETMSTPSVATDLPVATEVPADTLTDPSTTAPPLAIGESVMLGAAEQLDAGGFVVNADIARQGRDVPSIIGQYLAADQIDEVVVLQVGTNGPVDAETYDRIAASLADVDHVVFLTVYAPSRGWIEDNNALIWSLPARYPNVQVLDWAGLVSSGQVPGMAGDGVHLGTEAAKQFYANYVFGLAGRNDLVLPLPE